MKVIHLLSNFRWTERSEPAADLVLGQQARGVESLLVCGRNIGVPIDSVEYQARVKGLEPIALEMRKHFRWRPAVRDVRALRGMIADGSVDVPHSHLPNAHLIAAVALNGQARRPLLVHSLYEPEGPGRSLRARLISRPRTDGWVVISASAATRLVEKYHVEPQRVIVVEPPLDIDRFAAPASGDVRASFGLAADDFVVGVVARFSERRRIDLLLGAVQRIAEDCPRLRCLMIGRGDVERLVSEPAARMGIADRIVLGGYCRGDRLVEAYNAMDVFAYTAPGTDKSCRAVREALAVGLPVAASRVGYLPAMIEEGRTGYLFNPDPASMARVLRRSYEGRDDLATLGQAARDSARQRFARGQQADRIIAFYRRIAGLRSTADMSLSRVVAQ